MERIQTPAPKRGRPRLSDTPNPRGTAVYMSDGVYADLRMVADVWGESLTQVAARLIETHPDVIHIRREALAKAAA